MQRYKQSEIDKLVDILKNDGVISVPTDTVYGICARINSINAYNKLADIKDRPSNKSFPVMCADKEQIESIAIVDERIQKLINAFMPGPVTLVLNKRPEVLTYINNGGLNNSLEMAIRMAPTEILKELIYKVGSPIFMTSANHSGEPTCKNLDEIERTCPTLDGMMEGDVLFAQASTIIDCTSDVIKIQREGPISKEEIMKVLIDKKI